MGSHRRDHRRARRAVGLQGCLLSTFTQIEKRKTAKTSIRHYQHDLVKKTAKKRTSIQGNQHYLVKNENNNNIKFNLYMDLITTSTEVVLDSLEDTAMSATDP